MCTSVIGLICDKCEWMDFAYNIILDNRQMAELRVELRRMKEAQEVMKSRIEE